MLEEELSLKLDDIKQMIPKREWRFYHVLAIENFIYHLKNIKNERYRTRTAEGIANSLELVSIKLHDNSRLIDKGKTLTPAVWELSDIYRTGIGFIKKPDYLIIAILGICLFFLLRLSLTNLQAPVTTILVFSIYSFYGYLKIKARKFY